MDLCRFDIIFLTVNVSLKEKKIEHNFCAQVTMDQNLYYKGLCVILAVFLFLTLFITYFVSNIICMYFFVQVLNVCEC